jgi:acyl dehydratase
VEVVGLGFYFEDMPVGREFKTIRRTVTETDIVNFISATGILEVLFIDKRFLEEESDIKGRIAPGALGYCFAEGLLAQSTMQHTGFAFLEMHLKIENPLFAGDTIHVEVKVLEARLSKSRPGRGILRTHNRVVNQHGKTVLSYTPIRMIKCRPGATQ